MTISNVVAAVQSVEFGSDDMKSTDSTLFCHVSLDGNHKTCWCEQVRNITSFTRTWYHNFSHRRNHRSGGSGTQSSQNFNSMGTDVIWGKTADVLRQLAEAPTSSQKQATTVTTNRTLPASVYVLASHLPARRKLVSQGFLVGAHDDKSHPWQELFTVSTSNVVRTSNCSRGLAPLDARNGLASSATEQGQISNLAQITGRKSQFQSMEIQENERILPKLKNQKRKPA